MSAGAGGLSLRRKAREEPTPAAADHPAIPGQRPAARPSGDDCPSAAACSRLATPFGVADHRPGAATSAHGHRHRLPRRHPRGCMAELGHEVLGVDVDQQQDRLAGRRRGAVLRARPARAAAQEPGHRPAALHHRLRRGRRVRRRALRLRRHPAAARRVRRRPALRRPAVDRAGAAPDPPALVVGKSTVPVGTAERVARLVARHAPAGAASSWPGTRSSCARASRSRTRCAPTGWSSASSRGPHAEAYAAHEGCTTSPSTEDREDAAGRHRPRHRRAGQGRRRTRSWPPRSRSSTRWPRCARPPAPTSPSWPGARHDTRIGGRFLTPAWASAAAACPRTSARSWRAPASWASTRRCVPARGRRDQPAPPAAGGGARRRAARAGRSAERAGRPAGGWRCWAPPSSRTRTTCATRPRWRVAASSTSRAPVNGVRPAGDGQRRAPAVRAELRRDAGRRGPGADIVLHLTEWDEFRDVDPAHSARSSPGVVSSMG